MAQHFDYDNYDDRERYRRGDPREEGFFDRVRGWFRERVNDFDRERDDPRDRDYQPDWQRDPHRSRYNRDSERDYRSRRDYEPQESEWERTRQWRRDWPRYTDPRQEYGRDEYANRRGIRYGDSRDYHRDEDRYGQRYNQERERRYDEGYGGGYSRDYGPDYGRYYRSNYNRDYDSDFDQDYRRRGAYPSAGMSADYGSDFDYSDRYEEDRVNYGAGDIGYENEGAFYQDMDEPENYRSQVYRYGTERSPYLGVGPQGYKRSDERITDDVCERLTRHGRVDASQIHINVKDGEVTLTGKVPYRDMKRLAEDVVENISGVKDVHNEIRVEARDRQPWESQAERQRDFDWESRQTDKQSGAQSGSQTASQSGTPYRSQSASQNWETRAETELEGLEASGELDTGAASMEDLGTTATTQPTRTQRDITTGMEVIGTDGKLIGKVKEVRQNDFLIDREMARDVFVPFSAISMVGEAVMLNVNAGDVDMQGWEKPELF